jgi:hypothetical protein
MTEGAEPWSVGLWDRAGGDRDGDDYEPLGPVGSHDNINRRLRTGASAIIFHGSADLAPARAD